jgi:hypothetical protein
VFYNAGRDGEFFAVELVDGQVVYAFNMGSGSGPVRVRADVPGGVADSRWHAVSISRPASTRHVLMVDDAVSVAASAVGDEWDFVDLLYVGGMHFFGEMPDGVRARHGFRGCLASVTVNGRLARPIADAAISVARATVEDGCRAERSYCTATSCAHGGVCVQEWTGFSCDCDLTSYAGPTCNEGLIFFFFSLPVSRW